MIMKQTDDFQWAELDSLRVYIHGLTPMTPDELAASPEVQQFDTTLALFRDALAAIDPEEAREASIPVDDEMDNFQYCNYAVEDLEKRLARLRDEGRDVAHAQKLLEDLTYDFEDALEATDPENVR